MTINRIGDKIEFNLSDEEKLREGKWNSFEFDLLLTHKVYFDAVQRMWITDTSNEGLIRQIYDQHYPKVEPDNQLTLF